MTFFDLLVLLLVAGVCGALGQAITGFSRGGCLVSIALGFVGAVLGVWISRRLGLPELIPLQIGTTTSRSSGQSSVLHCLSQSSPC
jgi:uncharacterized membrane protein YeaQ/YmgE (transglycosylase-associated protein family)